VPQQVIDVELIVERSRILWRDASARVTTGRVELFVKTSSRVRVARDLSGGGVTLASAFESGLAVRVMQAGHDRAGFAASAGLGLDDVRWATDSALGHGAEAPAAEPRVSDIDPERWDLDDQAPLPTEDRLTSAVLSRSTLSWIEAGTTVEVLIGADGWLAARRRHRIWSLADDGEPRLFAQRGFNGWEDHLVPDELDDPGAALNSSPAGQTLILTPRAAAPIVAALVDAFHGAHAVPRGELGPGWAVADEPVGSGGLAGGSFDDAGFPAERRVLAAEGLWVDRLGGPGTYRRSSFRDPPTESASNLVMAGDELASFPRTTAIARRCRVIRTSPVIWVLELELAAAPGGRGEARRWVRASPEALLACCRSRLGGAELTPQGPRVPFLLFEGLPVL